MISEGDTVMVVRCCCEQYVCGQWVFVVACFHSPREMVIDVCSHCGRELPQEPFAAPFTDCVGAPVSWLKKIPPIEEAPEMYEDYREPVDA